MAITLPAAIRATVLVWICAVAAFSVQAQGRFTVSADGQLVTDSTSGLVWRRCAEGMKWNGSICAGKPLKYSFAGAKAAASAAAADGKGWRVPTKEELLSLVDLKAKKKPKIDLTTFPNTPSLSFWATRAGSDDNLNAWLINFANGKLFGNIGQAKFPLRLVRTGP
ncbi:MAG: Lcl C-terminal domain-containing protein [Caldimonas sp.]